ncbi:MAG: hypothetical protein K2M63_06205 [Muribaculaceae bacterium]|nr:hypothetical protein [Muribaculaceae bacterium]
MKNRKKRIDLIIELIKNQCIGSQEELAEILAQKGHPVTQATLSRDLKMLRTTKVPTDRGTYMYVLPDSDSLKDRLLNFGQPLARANYQSGFVSLQFSGHLAVIKTRNGYASGLAYDIDMSNYPEILGTISGTDTILAVLREDVSRARASELFSEILGIDVNELKE